jgi:hypothetical protein
MIVLVQRYLLANYPMYLGDEQALNIIIMKHILILLKKLMLLLIKQVLPFLQKFKDV